MNRGVLERSPVQQITAAGNPNWWSIIPSAAHSPPSTHHQFQFPPPPPTNNFHLLQPPQTAYQQHSFSPCNWSLNHGDYGGNNTQQDQITTSSWSQLFLSGLVGEEEKDLMSHFHVSQQALAMAMEDHVKQENSSCGFVARSNNNQNFLVCNKPNTCTATTTAAASNCRSPQSCISTTAKPDPPPAMVDRNSECYSSAAGNGGIGKKAKARSPSTQSTLKVRKFGDRITALHQLVSPFGKTDTASVLLEAVGYIRFLHSQIEALSLPYLGTENNGRQQIPQSVQLEKKSMFPEDPGQLLNDNCLKRKGGADREDPRKDLRSRGLCLVPVSFTLHVRRDNGADYWAPMLGGFR